MQRLPEVCLESRAPRGLAESQVLPSYNTSRDMNNRRAARTVTAQNLHPNDNEAVVHLCLPHYCLSF